MSFPSSKNLDFYRGDKFTAVIDNLGDLSSVDDIHFAVKYDLDSEDSVSQCFISWTAGLEYIAGEQAGTPANGSIAITVPATAGEVTVTLAAVEAAKLDPTHLWKWDIQVIEGTDVETKWRGFFRAVGDVARAVTAMVALCWTVGITVVGSGHQICA